MPQSSVDASVIVATYNQLETTRLAIRALAAQQTDFTYEIIVCDDGSDAATIGGLRDQLQAAPLPARLVWQQDQGFRAAQSRNNGIRLARGRVLIFLDGDMIPEVDFVETHVRAHARESVIAVGKRFWRDPPATGSGSGGESDDSVEALRSRLRQETATDPLARATESFHLFFRQSAQKTAPWLSCFSCNVSVPRSPLVEFDETFVGWGSEDYDLFYGLNAVHGFQVELVDAAAYDLQGGVEADEERSQRRIVSHLINAFRFYDKWAHTGLAQELAIPRYELNPETGRWRSSRLMVAGKTSSDFAEYVESARQWLLERDLYPGSSGAAFGPFKGATSDAGD